MPQVSKVSELLSTYTSILESCGYKVEENGDILIRVPTGTDAPAKVEGKKLVLPTEEHMRNGFGEDLQPYHPLCESMARQGTSPVQQHMQRTIKTNIVYVVGLLANALLRISIKTELHKDLPPDMLDVLMKLSDAKDETQVVLDKILAAANKKNRVCSVFLRGNTTLSGQKVNRACVIRFPIIEELDSDSPDVFGVKVVKKHRKVLSALFRIIVPNGDSSEEYSAGTTSRVAPYYTSMCEAWLKIGTQINRNIYRFSEPLQLGLSPFNLFDPKLIEKFPKLYNLRPSLNGNEGGKDVVPDEGMPGDKGITAAQVPTTVARAAQELAKPAAVPQMGSYTPTAQPTRQPVAATTPAANTMTMAEFNAKMNPQPSYPQPQPYMPQQQPMYGQQPQYPMQPQPMYGQQPQYGQMPYGQPPVQQGPAQIPWLAAQQQQQYQQQQMNQNPFSTLLQNRQPQYGQAPMPQQGYYGGNVGGGL